MEPTARDAAMLALLTEQERLYIVLVCRTPEPAKAEIAEYMGLATKTVDVHSYKLYKKLEVHTRKDLYVVAVRLGLVPCACRKGPLP